MRKIKLVRAAVCAALCVGLSGITGGVFADEQMPQSASIETPGLFERTRVGLQNGLQDVLGEALGLIGVPYRRGGSSPEKGLDCSGFVSHVYQNSIGLVLPRNAKAMSKEGDKVDKEELQPGDLVFFNTMRRAFSHVGIYLGDGLFVHSPRTGGKVRVEAINDGYWRKRYNGARRVTQD